MIWSKAFWLGLGERAIKTFAQAFLAAALASGVVSGTTGIDGFNWLTVVSIAGLATILSAITSIANANFTAGKTPVVETADAPSTVVNVNGAG